MRIVSTRRIRDFIESEPRSAEALWHWVDVVEAAMWSNPGELKLTFGTASFVGDLTVFNVSGPRYRLAAYVHYRAQIVYVKMIGTHEEYDKWEL